MSEEKMHSGGICHACGGMVDADGYAKGGEVEGDEEGAGALSLEDLPMGEGSVTDRRQKDIGAEFADAVFRRGRG